MTPMISSILGFPEEKCKAWTVAEVEEPTAAGDRNKSSGKAPTAAPELVEVSSIIFHFSVCAFFFFRGLVEIDLSYI